MTIEFLLAGTAVLPNASGMYIRKDVKMNPLYIALPIFVALVWVVAIVAVRHDKKVLDKNKML